MDRRIAGMAVGLVLSTGALLGACATAGGAGPRHTGLEGEALWLGRCGSCHERPAPERMDRMAWVATMNRHRRRAALSDAQLSQLVEFLAYRPGSSGDERVIPGRRQAMR